MSEIAVSFDHVWKKFRKGERFDSLRDLFPALAKRLWSGRPKGLEAREFWALRDVSFELKRGDSLGIIGPNGSGKSTTLKLLSRILKPDSGSLMVKGRYGALIELGAGFHPDLTGRENVYLNGTILGMKRAEIAKKFDAIVAFAELEEFLDTPVKRYSSGMYARLGFSVAAHVDPEVLIVDEVLSVGDYHFQEKCFARMHEFTRNGTTLVFVSHNLTAIGSLCKNGLLLNKGVPVFQGDVQGAIQKYYALYEEDTKSSDLEITGVRLTDSQGREREVFDPGEGAIFTVQMKALADIANAHACAYLRTRDGQPLFDTATSRYSDTRLTLAKGEYATAVFRMNLNLQNGVFPLGFSVSSEFDEYFIYCNMGLKQVVMTGNQKSNGFVHLNPHAELYLGKIEDACAVPIRGRSRDSGRGLSMETREI
jgi:lipopolysaccharide transport system ATP-binding protein